MDTWRKIKILGPAAQHDVCGSYLCETKKAERKRSSSQWWRWIYPAAMPDGQHLRLFKVLMSNICENNCGYCFTRCGRNYSRTSFTPEELARLFIDLWQRKLVQGLFLSSAIDGNANRCMAKMLATAEILRCRYRFPGYIHLKILPGASFGAVEQTMRWADRVSLNLEAPNAERLRQIAPDKDFKRDLMLQMQWASRFIRKNPGKHISQTTQFVVGAADESDHEILTTTEWLYQRLKLTRTYFSAFQPVRNTPLADHSPTPLSREHRLYQADFLIRKYGFKVDEIVFDSEGQLPITANPKMVWAENHPERFPIEVNTSTREELLRVPGIGLVSASRIIKYCQTSNIKTLDELRKLGVITRWASSYVLLDGRRTLEGSLVSRKGTLPSFVPQAEVATQSILW